jgi:hypothetical protein
MLSKLRRRRLKRTPQDVWSDRTLHDADALAVIAWGTKEGAVTDSRNLRAEWRSAMDRIAPEPSAYRPWVEPTGDAIRAASDPAIASATYRFHAEMESPEMPGPGYDARTLKQGTAGYSGRCHCGHLNDSCDR